MTRRREIDAFQEAWERGVPADEQVAALVRTAERVAASAAADPSPAFRASLRDRLMTEAASVLVAQPESRSTPAVSPARTPAPFRRRLAGLTAAAVASVGAITLVSSSAQALPGELLYPVKLGVENVQLTLKDEGADRGAYQLDRATERLREAEALAADTDRHGQLPAVLEDFTVQAENGSDALFDSFDATGDEHDIANVTAFAERSTTVLTTLSASDMPAEYVEAWEKAARTVTALADESSRRCSGCAPADVDDLVRSVAGEVAKEAAPEAPKSSGAAPPKKRSESASGPAPSRGAAGASRDGSSAAPPSTPSPAPTTRAPGLRTITDPVLGGLLGSEDQTGLVPGLLDGLLGGGK